MKQKIQIFWASALILIAILARLVPHAWNFTPVVGILLFSTFLFNGRWKFFVPALAIILSDLTLELTKGIGFHQGTWIIYISYALIVLAGAVILSKNTFYRVISASLTGSLIFFLVANFALFYPEVTIDGQLQGYPHSIEGILGSYTAGIPFFRNMVLGDLFFSFVLFGSYSFVTKISLKTQPE